MNENPEQSDPRVERSIELMDDPMVGEIVAIYEARGQLDADRRNDDSRVLREQLAVSVAQFVEKVGDENLALSAIYRKGASVALDRMIDVLDSDEYKKMSSSAIEGIDLHDGNKRLSGEEVSVVIKRIIAASMFLKDFGYDRPSGALKKSPFSTGAFEDIDIFDPVWQKNLEVGENFQHAFYRLYDAFIIVMAVPEICSGENDEFDDHLLVKQILQSTPGVVRVLRTFQSMLDGSMKNETVRACDVVSENPNLVDVRFAHENGMTHIPVEQNIPEDIVLNNIDPDALAVAIFEMQKNGLKEGKVTPGRLQEMLEAGEAYMTVSARETQLDGKDVVVFEVRDKGAQIDLMSVIRKSGDMFFGYEARDFTLGEVLDQLSQRHLSIPLKSGGEIHTGIGLHSARSIVKSFNGEIFPANLEDGVGFLIVIPKEGAESDWNVSDLNVSGLQCKELAGHIVAYQEEVQNMILTIVAMAAVVLRSSRNKPC